jgi:hypothetical protein
VIGYYIHHHGRGHLSRALAIARELGEPVTGLSSLSRPQDWPGDWLQLPLDELPGESEPGARARAEHDAGGRLHWVPLGSPGLRGRMAAIAGWIDAHRPRAVVVDVSVEVCLLVRLHGVPVVAFVLPGHRDDPAHELGFDVATTILAAWPPEASIGMVTGIPQRISERIVAVGAISRFEPISEPVFDARAHRTDEPRVLVLAGGGGEDFGAEAIRMARRETPGWRWTHLGGSATWTADPWPHIIAADVVVTHAGQGAVAEVAAARRPAVIIPQSRPHAEQQATGTILAGAAWPAIVTSVMPTSGWPDLLSRARGLDGWAWRGWNDGGGAARAAREIERTAERTRP